MQSDVKCLANEDFELLLNSETLSQQDDSEIDTSQKFIGFWDTHLKKEVEKQQNNIN